MKRGVAIEEILYWKSNPEWYTYDKSKGLDGYMIKPNAPDKAKKSFDEWRKHKDE